MEISYCNEINSKVVDGCMVAYFHGAFELLTILRFSTCASDYVNIVRVYYVNKLCSFVALSCKYRCR